MTMKHKKKRVYHFRHVHLHESERKQEKDFIKRSGSCLLVSKEVIWEVQKV